MRNAGTSKIVKRLFGNIFNSAVQHACSQRTVFFSHQLNEKLCAVVPQSKKLPIQAGRRVRNGYGSACQRCADDAPGEAIKPIIHISFVARALRQGKGSLSGKLLPVGQRLPVIPGQGKQHEAVYGGAVRFSIAQRDAKSLPQMCNFRNGACQCAFFSWMRKTGISELQPKRTDRKKGQKNREPLDPGSYGKNSKYNASARNDVAQDTREQTAQQYPRHHAQSGGYKRAAVEIALPLCVHKRSALKRS